jgi:hypothetical protein
MTTHQMRKRSSGDKHGDVLDDDHDDDNRFL